MAILLSIRPYLPSPFPLISSLLFLSLVFSLQGLRMFPAMIIVPLMQICWTLFSIVSGLLYFEEYEAFNALKGCMFALGVAVSVPADVGLQKGI